MSDLIEAVARAMYEHDYSDVEDAINVAQWKALRNVGENEIRQIYMERAQAALKAIDAIGTHKIVPVGTTAAMIKAGNKHSLQSLAAMMFARAKLGEKK